MNNTVVILGAGASVDAGVPASFEMTRAIRDALNTRAPFAVFTEALNYVCSQLLAHDAAHASGPQGGVDIERVFEALESLGRRNDMAIAPFLTGWQRDIEALERQKPMRTWIRRKLSAKWQGDSVGAIELSPAGVNNLWDQLFPWFRGDNLFEQLMSLVVDELCTQLTTDANDVQYLEPLVELGTKPGGITVATLNYDLAIEQASARLGTSAYTGLTAWVSDRSWLWPDDGLRLVKLHGSIDWYWKTPTNAVSPIRIETVDEEREEPSLFRPALLFGHGSKLRVEGPFLSLLAEFERLLAAAKTLVVVGYSFRDTHINHIVARWLAEDTHRRIIIIDPGFPELRRHHRDILRRPRSFREELFYGLSASRQSTHSRLHVIREPARSGLRTVLS